MNPIDAARKIWVRGIVQGVGFRPFVYNLAIRNGLTGWVRNTSAGVEIVINGSQNALDRFLAALREEPPPLAHIDQIEVTTLEPDHFSTFSILESQPNPLDFIPVSPDMAICADCARELFDPQDRRYRYPFINCTNCGPRFTIIQDIPYDRPQTTMAPFTMCLECSAEYKDPSDRRFHAQPVACPDCGPQVWLEVNGAICARKEDAIQAARAMIREGKILAIKGLGGFHLACDATQASAVSELRLRKKRSDKAFALMAFDLQTIEKHCLVNPQERELLLSPQHPIVLLQRKPGSTVAAETAPNQNTLGFMLAYTPLHLLLLEPAEGFPGCLVMTSANLSDEPIAYQDEDARTRLAPLADAFLLHNREIHTRVDDSVVRVAAGQPRLLRRARGYAPDPVRLPFQAPAVLATGGELKNAFCLTRQKYAFLSHHIGDMENYETLQSFEEGVRHYQRLFRIQPEILACDLHPNYLASRYARKRAADEHLPLVEVQHHHAHLAACLAENSWDTDEPVLGVTFDGTGYGPDGAIWGGEFLLGGYQGYERLAHLKYTPLPGGDLAVRNVARMGLAYLWSAGLDWDEGLEPCRHICADDRTILRTQLEKGINSPLTSSMGRLFDAVSALCGVRATATYEGQAAIELELLADQTEKGEYPIDLQAGEIDVKPLLQNLLVDWYAGTKKATLSARFHNSIARLVLDVAQQARTSHNIRTLALSGGVWQNTLLLTKTLALLENAGFTVLTHRWIPSNDGGIALGQAVIAAKRYNPKTTSMPFAAAGQITNKG